MAYDPARVIAVDVDGALHTNGMLNQAVVEFCRKQKAAGYTLYLWSARGQAYATMAAVRFEVGHLFDAILSKPGYVVDDQGWDWIRHTCIVRNPRDMSAQQPQDPTP